MTGQSGDVFGLRYGEVLLVRMGASGPEAAVFNSFPLNDCPAQLWNALDAEAIAKDNGAVAALLNGPRYWLMSGIEKNTSAPQQTMSFGGIDPDGQRWVMQTWSQTIDKNLTLDDLPGLANRLTLPNGWSYRARTLSSPLRVDTTTRDAHVIQDDLANSYSLQFE